ncbi:MAG: S8 family peptidase [bacterium]
MTMIYLCLLGFIRPDCLPVTGADVERVLALERTGAMLAAFCDRVELPDRWRDRVPGQFTVGFEPGQLAEAVDWLAVRGAEPVRVDTAGAFIVCTMADVAGVALAESPLPASVRWFEPDARAHASYEPNDPDFLAEQWDKWVTYADKAWDVTRGSGGITIAVCDNGVDYAHPDLSARFTPGEYGYDFAAGDNDPKPDNTQLPEAFHGTHVSGICAATIDNGIGIAGWAAARLLAVKVLSDSGSGSMSNLASGIRWATDRGARVVNMSLGSDDYSTPVAEAASYAAGKGVLMVAASGNQGAGTVQYPARLPEVVAVGATDRFGRLAEYSNYGAHQDIVAPGSYVRSCWTGGGYGLASGTSMASPQVAGIVALVFSVSPNISATRARAILGVSAIDMGPAGQDVRFGHGLTNAWRALTLAGTMARSSARPQESAATDVVRGCWRLPGWAERAELYDASGRGRAVTGRELSLSPGTWFVRLSGGDRTELVKVCSVR